MALKATIFKAQLNVADMDRHVYGDYSLTLARHPSETDQRMMLRLLAFALHADEQLEFGRGISTDDEPDLWQRDLTGEIERSRNQDTGRHRVGLEDLPDRCRQRLRNGAGVRVIFERRRTDDAVVPRHDAKSAPMAGGYP